MSLKFKMSCISWKKLMISCMTNKRLINKSNRSFFKTKCFCYLNLPIIVLNFIIIFCIKFNVIQHPQFSSNPYKWEDPVEFSELAKGIECRNNDIISYGVVSVPNSFLKFTQLSIYIAWYHKFLWTKSAHIEPF